MQTIDFNGWSDETFRTRTKRKLFDKKLIQLGLTKQFINRTVRDSKLFEMNRNINSNKLNKKIDIVESFCYLLHGDFLKFFNHFQRSSLGSMSRVGTHWRDGGEHLKLGHQCYHSTDLYTLTTMLPDISWFLSENDESSPPGGCFIELTLDGEMAYTFTGTTDWIPFSKMYLQAIDPMIIVLGDEEWLIYIYYS